jgi:chitin disaccharide deacetylase
MPDRITNRLLGYPDDARLLLVNADDLGRYPAINAAIVQAFREGIVRSTSLMMPCPGAADAIRLLGDHPALRVGVHLSVVNDIAGYRWGPLAPKERVPSLLDEEGRLFHLSRLRELLERARLEELEIEFRAQIGAAFAAGLAPTHLDWHCTASGGRPDIFALTRDLAREYRLALQVGSRPFIDDVRAAGLPALDHPLLDSFRLPIEAKSTRYADLFRALPAGLSEWAVHPGHDTPEARATDPDGWLVRRTDLDFLVSTEAKEIVAAEGIVLIDYRALRDAWLGAAA